MIYIYIHTYVIYLFVKPLEKKILGLPGPGDLFHGLRLCRAAPGRHGGHLGRSLPRRRQQRQRFSAPEETGGGVHPLPFGNLMGFYSDLMGCTLW